MPGFEAVQLPDDVFGSEASAGEAARQIAAMRAGMQQVWNLSSMG